MPKLLVSMPVREQVRAARERGIPIGLDATGNAMGDKIAIYTMAIWMLAESLCEEITILESRSDRTPFMLSDCTMPEGIKVEVITLGDTHPYLDCVKSGNRDSVWVLNPYMAAIGIHPELMPHYVYRSEDPKKSVVFIPLTNVEYNQRRNIDLAHAQRAVEYLRSKGLKVRVLFKGKSEYLPDAEELSFKDTVSAIANASCFIGGESGFALLAPAMGVPTVALFPDWFVLGKSDMASTYSIAEWWEVPAWYTPYSFIPNAPFNKLRIVELNSKHEFSLAHLLESVNAIRLC